MPSLDEHVEEQDVGGRRLELRRQPHGACRHRRISRRNRRAKEVDDLWRSRAHKDRQSSETGTLAPAACAAEKTCPVRIDERAGRDPGRRRARAERDPNQPSPRQVADPEATAAQRFEIASLPKQGAVVEVPRAESPRRKRDPARAENADREEQNRS